MSESTAIECLNSFLNAYWLRPETALWRALDVQAMAHFNFEGPSLDLGCGDGTFSFLRAGGQFKESFDVFLDISNLDEFFERADVYNTFNDKVNSSFVALSPKYRISVGLDHKEALLAKASCLHLFDKLVHHDANQKLPFNDESFQSIFSNIIYWLDNPLTTFQEVRRVLRQGGRGLFMLPNHTLKDYSAYYSLFKKTNDPRWAWLERLDRGRLAENIKHANSDIEWRRIFDEAGLGVVRHTRHLSKLTFQIWDIGLRPIFPVLAKMSNAIQQDAKSELKSEWIDLFRSFLIPIIELEQSSPCDSEPAFHCYTLERK